MVIAMDGAERSEVTLVSDRAVVLRSDARSEGGLRGGGRIGNGDASRDCALKTGHPRSRKAEPVRRSGGLLAGVPEALPPARVGVVPAEARSRSGAGPRRSRRRADKPKRRAGRDRAARRPAVPGTRPTAITVSAAAIHASTIRRAATISAASVGRPATVRATAVGAPTVGGSATIGATAAMNTPTVSAATAIRPAAAVHSARRRGAFRPRRRDAFRPRRRDAFPRRRDACRRRRGPLSPG